MYLNYKMKHIQFINPLILFRVLALIKYYQYLTLQSHDQLLYLNTNYTLITIFIKKINLQISNLRPSFENYIVFIFDLIKE